MLCIVSPRATNNKIIVKLLKEFKWCTGQYPFNKRKQLKQDKYFFKWQV